MGDLEVVILGASIAGCCAAAALAGDGRRVLMLERDTLPTVPQPRRGVPQGSQPHVFLARGMRETETLLPGLDQRLRAAGAVPVDTGGLPWLTEWGWLPPGPPIEILSMTRPLLEHELRTATLRHPAVSLREQADVRGLRRAGDGWVVTLADGDQVRGDVVIDAMGRSSRLPTWLGEEGIPQPKVSAIDAQIGYATRVFTGRSPTPGVAVPLNPQGLRGGYGFPVENGQWLVAAVGCGDRRPPRDIDGYHAALAALEDPVLADLAASLDPVGGVTIHRQTDNRRRHYERLRQLPPGLLVVGDALCVFSPVYGQGISVAAMQASVLRQRSSEVTGTAALRSLQRAIAGCTRVPWLVAAGADSGYATCIGRPSVSQRLGDVWGRRLTRAAVGGDRAALAALFGTYHLIASPTALVRPRVLVGGALAGRRRRHPDRPVVLAAATTGSTPRQT